MRIGLVCPYSMAVPGGVQSHVRDLAETLADSGHEVRVLAPGGRSEALPAYVTTVGRAVPVPYNGSVARVSFGPRVAGRVRRWVQVGDFDVLHIHEPATPSVSVLALWSARSPVVATYHTAQDRPLALTTTAPFLRSGLNKIGAHIAVSPAAASTLARYHRADPLVIPNGVHAARFRRSSRSTSRREPPTLVFVGRADESRKGFTVLLRAMPLILLHHPGARLLVVGADAPAARRDRALHRRVADNVTMLGVLDDAAKARVLASADLLVAPNTRGESFGIVLVEAMAAGVPVVASDLPAFEALVSGSEAGRTFPTGDHRALAAVVIELLDDHAARRALTRGARQTALQHDWSVLAPRLVDVYRAVAGGRGGVPLEASMTRQVRLSDRRSRQTTLEEQT